MRIWVLLLSAGALAGCFGAPVDATEACGRYVRCIQGLDAVSGDATNLDRYLLGGACWKNSTLAEMCDTSCTRALERLGQQRITGVPECAP